MLGAMQEWDLRVTGLLDHAAREHGTREIVTHWVDGSETRTDWAGIRHDALKMVQALRRLDIYPGDRVATLAMNHGRHLAAWFGVTGAGCVLHTLNPRLFEDQLAWIVNDASDRVLIYDAAFQPSSNACCRAAPPSPMPSASIRRHAGPVSMTGSGWRTAGRSGRREPSAMPACCAIPAVRPGIPRGCSIPTAPTCFTPWRSLHRPAWPWSRDPASCRWCRCFMRTIGGCPGPAPRSARRWSGARPARLRRSAISCETKRLPMWPGYRPSGSRCSRTSTAREGTCRLSARPFRAAPPYRRAWSSG